VYEHLCELTPGENLQDIDGHLIVVLLDDSDLSEAFAEHCERRVTGLSDKAEFSLALARAEDFRALSRRALEFPALFHFACGVENARMAGVDDCLEFLREFILNNMRQ